MSVFRYSTYKIRIDPDSNKTQGLQTGDIVRRQYTGRDRAVYSLMVVLEAGVETVGDKEAPYFIGALLDGDEPQNCWISCVSPACSTAPAAGRCT